MAMAKIICTCNTCGKEYEVTKQCHNRREADNWESWAANSGYYTECPDCYKARIAAEREAANEAAAAEAAANKWAELTGSAKQISWAERIRRDMVDKLSAEPCDDEHRELFRRCLDRLIADHTAAAWWIDNRSDYRAVMAAFLAPAKEIADQIAAETTETVTPEAETVTPEPTETEAETEAAPEAAPEAETMTPADGTRYTLTRCTLTLSGDNLPELIATLIPALYYDDARYTCEEIATFADAAAAEAALDRKGDAAAEIARTNAGYTGRITYYEINDSDGALYKLGEMPVLLTPAGDYGWQYSGPAFGALGYWERIDD